MFVTQKYDFASLVQTSSERLPFLRLARSRPAMSFFPVRFQLNMSDHMLVAQSLAHLP